MKSNRDLLKIRANGCVHAFSIENPVSRAAKPLSLLLRTIREHRHKAMLYNIKRLIDRGFGLGCDGMRAFDNKSQSKLNRSIFVEVTCCLKSPNVWVFFLVLAFCVTPSHHSLACASTVKVIYYTENIVLYGKKQKQKINESYILRRYIYTFIYIFTQLEALCYQSYSSRLYDPDYAESILHLLIFFHKVVHLVVHNQHTKTWAPVLRY